MVRGACAVVLGVVCTLGPGCQSPRLTAATAAARPTPTQARGAGRSEAERLGQPLLGRGEASQGGPYNRPVSDEAIRAVEQAVRLRLEARRPKPNPCGPIPKAERMKPPTGRGDEYTGAGVDLGPLLKGLEKLLRR